MQREIEQQRLDWPEEYLRHLEQRGDPASSRAMADYLRGKDTFSPEAIGQFKESDLDKMLLLLKKVTDSAYKVHYYIFYMQIIEKVAVLLAAQYPEKFATLDAEGKDRLFGAKMSLPNERTLYEVVYSYLLGHKELPDLVFPTGLTMRDYLEKMGMENAELADERLRELIGAANDQYEQYFWANFSEGNEQPDNY